MTYTLVWRNEARKALSRLRTADPLAAKRVTAAVRALATNPHSETSSQLGDSRFWRLKLGEWRMTYEVDDADRTVHVYYVGRMPPARRH